jgi:hypothetical protein
VRGINMIRVTMDKIGKFDPLQGFRRLVLELASDILMITTGLAFAYYVRVALLLVK